MRTSLPLFQVTQRRSISTFWNVTPMNTVLFFNFNLILLLFLLISFWSFVVNLFFLHFFFFFFVNILYSKNFLIFSNTSLSIGGSYFLGVDLVYESNGKKLLSRLLTLVKYYAVGIITSHVIVLSLFELLHHCFSCQWTITFHVLHRHFLYYCIIIFCVVIALLIFMLLRHHFFYHCIIFICVIMFPHSSLLVSLHHHFFCYYCSCYCVITSCTIVSSFFMSSCDRFFCHCSSVLMSTSLLSSWEHLCMFFKF